MWWNRGTRFPENFREFGIAQKMFKTKFLHVSYLINSAFLLYHIVILSRFGLMISILVENFTQF